MSSKTTSFSLLFYVSKTKLQKNGEAPLLLKINVNGRRVVINLRRSVNPMDWDSDKGRVGGKSDQAKVVNEYIEVVKFKFRQKYNELIQLHDELTVEMLRDAVIGSNASAAKTIIAVWEDHLEGMRKLIGKETTRATCQKYSAALNHIQRSKKPILFPELLPLNSHTSTYGLPLPGHHCAGRNWYGMDRASVRFKYFSEKQNYCTLPLLSIDQ